MNARIPVIPTVIVGLAAAAMVALGVWQLGRADEKAALLASYKAAGETEPAVDFPLTGDGEDLLFRRSALTCSRIGDREPVAGTAANGAKGWAVRVTCVTANGSRAIVDLGFTRDLASPRWDGGPVRGIIAPGPRLVADPPVANLYPLARPDPGDLPNNHLSYAVQWFIFALTALVIYVIAVRARLKRRPD